MKKESEGYRVNIFRAKFFMEIDSQVSKQKQKFKEAEE